METTLFGQAVSIDLSKFVDTLRKRPNRQLLFSHQRQPFCSKHARVPYDLTCQCFAGQANPQSWSQMDIGITERRQDLVMAELHTGNHELPRSVTAVSSHASASSLFLHPKRAFLQLPNRQVSADSTTPHDQRPTAYIRSSSYEPHTSSTMPSGAGSKPYPVAPQAPNTLQTPNLLPTRPRFLASANLLQPAQTQSTTRSQSPPRRILMTTTSPSRPSKRPTRKRRRR